MYQTALDPRQSTLMQNFQLELSCPGNSSGDESQESGLSNFIEDECSEFLTFVN
jgi:hypothetical protein